MMILNPATLHSLMVLTPFIGSVPTWSPVEPRRVNGESRTPPVGTLVDRAPRDFVGDARSIAALPPGGNGSIFGTGWSPAAPRPTDSAAGKTPVAAASDRVPYDVSFAVDARRIAALCPGWDGPGSVAIAAKVLRIARSLTVLALEGVVDAVAPQLMPGGDGSLQLEWHTKHGEIEFLIEPDCTFSIWGRDRRNGLEFEDCGKAAVGLFFRWTPRVAAPASHAVDVPSSLQPAVFEIAA